MGSSTRNSFGILLRSVPGEAHRSLNKEDQAHGPLKRIYEKMTKIENLSQDIMFSLAANAVNEFQTVNGVILMQLV